MRSQRIPFLALVFSGCVGQVDGLPPEEAQRNSDERTVGSPRPANMPAPVGVTSDPVGPVIGGLDPAVPVKVVPAVMACAGVTPPPRLAARIRRLTRIEYANTVQDLLGESVGPELLTSDPASHHFNTNPDVGVVSRPDVETYQLASRVVTANAMTKKNPLLTCVGDEVRCVAALLDGFAMRAFRRPLTRDERTRYDQFFTASRAVRGFSDSARLFVQATLQSPSFLYRTELGARPTAKGSRSVTVDPYEAASALSYLFTGTLPDAELFAAAAAGRLSTASEIETQARRLLLSPRGLHVVRNFFEQWLDLDQVETIARDKTAYPEWTPALARAMRVEVMDFIEKIVWAGDAKVATLLGSSSTFAGSALGGLYGRPGLPTAPAKLELDATQRAGILTLPAILTMSGSNAGSSPLYRGKLVAEKLFCVELPPPPDGADQTKFAQVNPTPRQESEARLGDPLCGGCHQLMDRTGFGFENYDGIGRHRTSERNQPIDGRGEIVSSGDADGPFNGPRGLVPRVLGSGRFAACFVSQTAEYALGLDRKTSDACLVPTVRDRWQRAGGDLRELLVALAGAPEFRERMSQEEP